MNPYRGLPDFCFWSRAMTWPSPGQIDPVTSARQIVSTDKVATMGSCFAQHLARHIEKSGLHFYVPEDKPEDMDAAEARRRNYRVFSARYGNIYTVMQGVQLFDRAFDDFQPVDAVWPVAEGFVDAFRPTIDPQPHATLRHALEARDEHLDHVRSVFTKSDWLVFTLGLTETWRSKEDGAVYPVAPGVSGGAFDPARYEFVNYSAGETIQHLELFITKLVSVNPRLKVILTVSPVPLIATYEKRHVWVSTTVSKACLRVAADEIERKFSNVFYFPSYEIITSPAAGSRYYQDDLRQVTDLGVRHVMRMFGRHYIADQLRDMPTAPPNTLTLNSEPDPEIVCDEELIEASIRVSRLSAG